MNEFGQRLSFFFKKLNRQAEKRLLRKGLKLIGKPALDHYYREYYQSVKDGLKEWELTGRDLLFHGAPAVIIVGTKPGGSCPMEDALLATQNILLAAHSMGLGTCLIGFAVSAIERASSLKAFLKIPPDESIYAAIAAGYPDEHYQRLPGRKPAPVRVWPGA